MRATNIEGLETCAFCDYFVILPSDIKIINCFNLECSKQTCRLDIPIILYIPTKNKAIYKFIIL